RNANLHDTAGERTGRRERPEDGVPQPSFDAMVLDRDDQAGGLQRFTQAIAIDRFHAVGIYHANPDPFLPELTSGGQSLVDGDAGGDDRRAIVAAGPMHLRASDRELLIGAVKGWGSFSRGSDVRDPLEV